MPKKDKANTLKETECTSLCQSVEHANELISAITLPLTEVLDKQLASYFKSKCSNFAKARDDYGRTLLHVAASCGRRDLCLWLLKCYSGNINAQDGESNYTALHRSLAYGFINVAVSLIQMNADLDIRDNEDLNPLDIVMRNIDVLTVERLVHAKFPSSYPKFGTLQSIFPDKFKKENSYGRVKSFASDKLEMLYRLSNAFSTEVYTWGTNLNYTSGFGSESGKQQPEFLEFFERKNEVIVEVSLNKFHALFMSVTGNVWSCGIGQGGRLGLPCEKIVLIPEKVPLASLPNKLFCITAAAGRDHSIFLCNDNKVFVCGTNTYHQLGLNSTLLSVIKPIKLMLDIVDRCILGVAASDYHSVVWTSVNVFTCGLHAGQLGHPQSSEATIPTFKKVPCLNFTTDSIITLVVSEAATVVATDSYMFVLTNYECLKIEMKFILKSIEENYKARRRGRYLDAAMEYRSDRCISKLAVVGGVLDSEKTRSFSISYAEALNIAVSFFDGSVYLWQKKHGLLLKCYFLSKLEIVVTNLVLNSTGMLFCTMKGELLKAKFADVVHTYNSAYFSVESYNGYISTQHHYKKNKHGTMDQCYLLQVEKIRNVFRAIAVFSDPKGDNFTVLQHRSAGTLMQIPVSIKNTLKVDLTNFYHETEEGDSFHDIVYKVEEKLFAAHKYVLASCSEKFLMFEENDGVVVIEEMSSETFETILEFAYTGCCRIRKGFSSGARTERRVSISTWPMYSHRFKQVLRAAQTFEIELLLTCLKQVKLVEHVVEPDSDYVIEKEFQSSPSFNRMRFSSLYDIRLRSQDGPVFNAHKCILVARVEYFKSMFSGHWIESRSKNQELLMPMSSAVLNEILDFLYTDKVSKYPGKSYNNQFWTSLLMAADQFLLIKLKEFTERSLAQCLDTRNVVDYLVFASVVNADQLKIACFHFICTNLPAILYFRYLEKLDDLLLNELTEYFRTTWRTGYFKSPIYYFENIPVYFSDTCNVEEIFNAEQTHPVDWNVIHDTDNEIEPVIKPEKAKKKKKKNKSRTSSTSETENPLSSNKNKSDSKIIEFIKRDEILTPEVKKNVVVPKEEWVAVNRQLKSVKSRLKVNAAVKEIPELLEQKENYIPLGVKKSPNGQPFAESELNISQGANLNDSHYLIDINFANVSPKITQAEKKRLRRISDSSKDNASISSPENKLCTDFMSVSPTSPGCWRSLNNSADEAASFSSIMASEQKMKTRVIKETKKIETKSLYLTQIEEHAIQELNDFYNAKNVDDEHITVGRVVIKMDAPQWVTK